MLPELITEADTLADVASNVSDALAVVLEIYEDEGRPLPTVRAMVDPVRWLDSLHGQTFKRRVDATGTVRLDKDRYYISQDRSKQMVLLQIDAPQRQINVLVEGEVIKTMPLKGLTQQPLPFDDVVNLARRKRHQLTSPLHNLNKDRDISS